MALADVTMRELLIFEAHDAAEKLHLARIAELEAELRWQLLLIGAMRHAIRDYDHKTGSPPHPTLRAADEALFGGADLTTES